MGKEAVGAPVLALVSRETWIRGLRLPRGGPRPRRGVVRNRRVEGPVDRLFFPWGKTYTL